MAWWWIASYLVSLSVTVLSGFAFRWTMMADRYLRIHVALLVAPILIPVAALLAQGGLHVIGPWRLTDVGWLIAGFVQTISWIVQSFSVRYLHGEALYRSFFGLLSAMVACVSLTWLANDARMMLLTWGVCILALHALIRGAERRAESRAAATRALIALGTGWLSLAGAVTYLHVMTASWTLSSWLQAATIRSLQGSPILVVDLLFTLTALISAGQWPFHRWFLNTGLVQTPVSAIMHAGLVNMGGVLLTQFAPLFQSVMAHVVLLVMAFLSVCGGLVMLRVQVDYKRQLMASTLSQMGFMLVQCALGSYGTALIHLILHGFYKITLFFQAGTETLLRENAPVHVRKVAPTRSVIMGGIVVAAFVTTYFLYAPVYLISWWDALLVGWTAVYAWVLVSACAVRQHERIVQWLIVLVGTACLIGTLAVGNWLTRYVAGVNPNFPSGELAAGTGILALAVMTGAQVLKRRYPDACSSVYLWIVYLGEPDYTTHTL